MATEEKKLRLQVNMTRQEMDELDAARKPEKIARSYLLRRAIKVYLLIAKSQREGAELYLEHPDGRRERIHII